MEGKLNQRGLGSETVFYKDRDIFEGFWQPI